MAVRRVHVGAAADGVADGPNAFAHVFNATTMPPTYNTSIKLRDEPEWFTCSIDGRALYRRVATLSI